MGWRQPGKGQDIEEGSPEKATVAKARRTGADLSSCDKQVPNFVIVISILSKVKAELINPFNTEQILASPLKGRLKIITSFCMGRLFGQIRNLSFYFQKTLDNESLIFSMNT